MLHWPPQAFWASNVWELSHAYEGYAMANGINKPDNPDMYPDDESRKRLREMDEKSRKDKVSG